MKEMLAHGTTLLYVSHSIQSVEKLCSHALWLEKGRVKLCGEAERVCRAYMGQE